MSKEKRYELRIQVELSDRRGSDRLNISEIVELDVDGFLELCGVLAKFHDLAAKIREGL